MNPFNLKSFVLIIGVACTAVLIIMCVLIFIRGERSLLSRIIMVMAVLMPIITAIAYFKILKHK